MQNNEKDLNFQNPNTPLIKVEQKDGQQLVSARELYAFLGVATRFDIWIIRMFEYGFIPNQDYTEVTTKNEHNSKVVEAP
jgi:phage anti-repressor protein